MRRALALALSLAAATPAAGDATLRFGRFGTVTLYGSQRPAAQVVLFVSGDGGWNQGVVDMARQLASLDALVAGVDIRTYLAALKASKEKCDYAAADFEELSKFIQKKLGLTTYSTPILVGYSSGATLVYAVLAEAPPNTFKGAISLGFCPDLPLTKPLCRGNGLEWTPGPKGKGVVFLPAKALPAPWIAFQGTIDQVCDPKTAADFAKKTGGGELVLLPKVGHGFSVPRNWLPQFKDAFARVAKAARPAPVSSAAALPALPLVELAAEGPQGDALAVIVTGDGGWAGIDREIGGALARKGIPVVGVNSLQYFWTPRTPEGASRDLAAILRHYLASWKKDRAIVVGYSFGADVLPFLLSRLPDDLKGKVTLAALLSPSRSADFEFHLTDWVGSSTGASSHPVLPEIRKLAGMKILCLAGADEKDSLCSDLGPKDARVLWLPGGHHFDGAYESIAETILREAGP